MRDQIETITKSLHTNIAMCKAMVKLRNNVLAKKYLLCAKKDAILLKELRIKWDLDATQEFTME